MKEILTLVVFLSLLLQFPVLNAKAQNTLQAVADTIDPGYANDDFIGCDMVDKTHLNF